MLWPCFRRLVERSQSVLSGSKGSKSRQSEPATSASSGHGGHGHSRVRAVPSHRHAVAALDTMGATTAALEGPAGSDPVLSPQEGGHTGSSGDEVSI